MTPEKINRMKLVSHLLPDPGGEVVRQCLVEIERLRSALEDIAYPMKRLEREAEEQGLKFDGMAALGIASDQRYLKDLALNTLQEQDK